MSTIEQPLTKEEIAGFFRVKPQTVDYWNARGCPRAKAGNRMLYQPSKVWEWLADRTRIPRKEEWDVKVAVNG